MPSRRTLLATGLSATALAALAYRAWPRLDDYLEAAARLRRLPGPDPQLAEFVRMACLAANGHNTQPWRFRLGADRVAILPDFTRRTEVVDPDDHHLFVSLGCAAENLIVAAGANGRLADLRFEGAEGGTIDIALRDGPASGDALYRAIPLRQSTRTAFDGQPVSTRDLGLLEQAARQDGVSLRLFTAPAELEDILGFVIEGNTRQMNDPAFVAELRHWIRFSPDEAMAAGDGLFAAASGNPVAPGWMARRLFGWFFTPEGENDKYARHIRSSSGVAVFTGDRADPEHWIAVGRSFQRFALQATALGLRTAHINQPVEVAPVRQDFAGWLGAPGARPDLVIRFGRAEALPMSLRRPVAQVIV
ncbi:MAG: Tat pathway signal protein [Paracoccaceae bacterium]